MSFAKSICAKLSISVEELNAMYTNCPVRGFAGTEVAKEIRRRFKLDDDEPLGFALARVGVLTEEEARWLDDAE